MQPLQVIRQYPIKELEKLFLQIINGKREVG